MFVVAWPSFPAMKYTTKTTANWSRYRPKDDVANASLGERGAGWALVDLWKWMEPLEIAQPRPKLSVAQNLISQSHPPATRPGSRSSPEAIRAPWVDRIFNSFKIKLISKPALVASSATYFSSSRLGVLWTNLNSRSFWLTAICECGSSGKPSSGTVRLTCGLQPRLVLRSPGAGRKPMTWFCCRGITPAMFHDSAKNCGRRYPNSGLRCSSVLPCICAKWQRGSVPPPENRPKRFGSSNLGNHPLAAPLFIPPLGDGVKPAAV